MKREHKTGPTLGDLDNTPVRYSMTEGVVTLSPLATVAEMAGTMVSEGIHAVVVARPLGPGEDPRGSWGVVSDLDLVSAGRSPGTTAAELAASPTLSVSPDDSLARAADLMREHRTSHVLVVGYDGVPLGVVSTLDIARVLARRPAVVSERPGA
jgi:CBS domain-containing protein